MSFWTDKAQRKRYKGFTLVEMSIVLVIIGLILGAISIGKDLQRDAEYNKIKQKFVDGWVRAYNAYYQRTGVVVGDSQENPQYMVNGIGYLLTGGTASGGDMVEADAPTAVCQDAAGPGMERGAATNTDVQLHTLMDRTGIRMPPGRAEGQEDHYVYLDTNGNPQEVQVCFQWNTPGTAEGSGNVMVLTGLTPDLARALDVAVDGKADAREGLFRQQGIVNDTNGTVGTQWQANNTQDYTDGSTLSENDGGNLDEDQVQTVVAIYKMNQ